MDAIKHFFDELIAAFAILVTAGFVVWMAFVIVLFFKEILSPGDLKLRDYFYRVWRSLILAFELTSYGGIFYSIYMFRQEEENLRFGIMIFWAILGSILFLKLRFFGGFKFWKKSSKQKD